MWSRRSADQAVLRVPCLGGLVGAEGVEVPSHAKSSPRGRPVSQLASPWSLVDRGTMLPVIFKRSEERTSDSYHVELAVRAPVDGRVQPLRAAVLPQQGLAAPMHARGVSRSRPLDPRLQGALG